MSESEVCVPAVQVQISDLEAAGAPVAAVLDKAVLLAADVELAAAQAAIESLRAQIASVKEGDAKAEPENEPEIAAVAPTEPAVEEKIASVDDSVPAGDVEIASKDEPAPAEPDPTTDEKIASVDDSVPEVEIASVGEKRKAEEEAEGAPPAKQPWPCFT